MRGARRWAEWFSRVRSFCDGHTRTHSDSNTGR